MADPVRNETLDPNNPFQSSSAVDPSVESLLPGFTNSAPALPPAPENQRLNRAAESIGAALGTTVGKVRSGLTLVQSRSEEATRGVTESISQQAQTFSAAAVEQAEHLGDIAEEKISQAVDTAQEQWDSLRRKSRQAVVEARRQVAIARQERPVELILGFAALSFVVGFALRVWRSNND